MTMTQIVRMAATTATAMVTNLPPVIPAATTMPRTAITLAKGIAVMGQVIPVIRVIQTRVKRSLEPRMPIT